MKNPLFFKKLAKSKVIYFTLQTSYEDQNCSGFHKDHYSTSCNPNQTKSGVQTPFFHHPITLKVCFLQKPDLFDLTDNSPRSMTLIPSWEHCQNPSANHFIYVFALAPCVGKRTSPPDF